MLSLVIPIHDVIGRMQSLEKTVTYAVSDERISEIVLSCEPGQAPGFTDSKIKIIVNGRREFPFGNKFLAMRRASEQWCILLDSDNTIDSSYVDALMTIDPWEPNTIYQPEFAITGEVSPKGWQKFDFRGYAGLTIDMANARRFMGSVPFRIMLNSGNFFVNREFYLNANATDFNANVNPQAADVILAVYNMMRQGGKICVVPGLQYQHAIGRGFYAETAHESTAAVQMIEKKFM